jgi:hypothetical protein
LGEPEVSLDEGLLGQIASGLEFACEVIAETIDHIPVAVY